jgi:hypothetical protein
MRFPTIAKLTVNTEWAPVMLNQVFDKRQPSTLDSTWLALIHY